MRRYRRPRISTSRVIRLGPLALTIGRRHSPQDLNADRPDESLAAQHPEMTTRLTAAFVDVWLSETRFPAERRAEAMGLLTLMICPEPDLGTYSLRMTFAFTGESWWLPDWTLDESDATAFVTRCATLAAAWVAAERGRYGPTAWD